MPTLNSSSGPLALLPAATSLPGSAGAESAQALQVQDGATLPGFSSVLDALMPVAAAATLAPGLPPAGPRLPLSGNIPEGEGLPVLPSTQWQSTPALGSYLSDSGSENPQDLEAPVSALLQQIDFGTVEFRSEVAVSEADEDSVTDAAAALTYAEVPAPPLALYPVQPAQADVTEVDTADSDIVLRNAGMQPAAMTLMAETVAKEPALAEVAEEDGFLLPEDSELSLQMSPVSTSSSSAAQNAQSVVVMQALTAATEAPLSPQSVTAGSVNTVKASQAELPDSFHQALRSESLEFGADRREWGNALGSRIVLMVANDIQQARIQLDPPELGSLEIRLQVQQDQATVQVQTQNPQVRDVLEASAQRLRDALAGQGIQLSGFDVSDRGQQQKEQHDHPSGHAEGGDDVRVADDESGSDVRKVQSLNLLDTFA